MKNNLYLVLMLLFATLCQSQDYNLIKKAEKKLLQKEYAKALRLLNKAETADYGFCGNAKMEALYAINELKFKLYKESGTDAEFRAYLNTINSFFEHSTVYSIERITLARKQFNDSELHVSILKNLSNLKEADQLDYLNLLPIQIKEDYVLKLFVNSNEVWKLQKQKNRTYNEALIDYYKQSEYYTLLNQEPQTN